MFHKIRRSFSPMQLEHLFFFFPHTKEMRRVFQTRRCIQRERKKYQLSLTRSETRKKRVTPMRRVTHGRTEEMPRR